MDCPILLAGELKKGKYYQRIIFTRGLLASSIRENISLKNPNIYCIECLGKLVDMTFIGRPYDPDVLFTFETETGKKIHFEPSLGNSEFYIEYIPDTEEMTKERIIKRTLLLRNEILGNDWALRPDNVVATQGIDLSGWTR
jgi:hypothetical protein